MEGFARSTCLFVRSSAPWTRSSSDSRAVSTARCSSGSRQQSCKNGLWLSSENPRRTPRGNSISSSRSWIHEKQCEDAGKRTGDSDVGETFICVSCVPLPLWIRHHQGESHEDRFS